MDALHEERELRVHVFVEALEECLADILAHLGVAFDSNAGGTSEQKREVLLEEIEVETCGGSSSLACLLVWVLFVGTYRGKRG